MKTLSFIAFLIFFEVANSQVLIPEAEKLKTAFENLSLARFNLKQQENYINAFPDDSKTFLKIFQTEEFDQLYPEYDKYILELDPCALNYPEKVLSKCINICKNLSWEADAVSQIQHFSLTLNTKYITVFITIFNKLKTIDQDNIIKFYADVENHNSYNEYQELINKLNSVYQFTISKKFILARKNRKLEIDH